MAESAADSIIARYARGEISIMRAAALLGDDVSVSEVFLMLLAAGFTPPLPPPEQQAAELRHAIQALGLDRKT